MQREMSIPNYQRTLDIVRRANQIAASHALDELLERTLDLFIEVACAESGILYLYDDLHDELILKVACGNISQPNLLGARFSTDHSPIGAALRLEEPIFVADLQRERQWNDLLSGWFRRLPRTAYCLPLALPKRPVGVVQVFNVPLATAENPEEIALLFLLGNCMVSEIEKARLLNEAHRRERRLSALVDIISRLTTTLDRRELLTLIMDHARELLDVEATSVWELDLHQNVLVPHVATGKHGERMQEVTVPIGQGIIGHVVETGDALLVEDVSKDERHYPVVDRQIGFETRSILCVPLRAPRIQLGGERGELQAGIIGGAQALNKRGGRPFTRDDQVLFEVFASQAANVLQLARLYQETHELFLGVINVVASAIDAKDPYTQGHAQRVSEVSVAIAEELGLSQEDIYHIKIGGILHDVGKLGVPDAILKKQAGLSDDEFDEMKKHPVKGHEIMRQGELGRLLYAELPALLEHHERLDGSGYPQGLIGDQISQIGRIVAVADVFDALTSDRPYRPGAPADEALRYLQQGASKGFDAECVAALSRAWSNGKIKTQREE